MKIFWHGTERTGLFTIWSAYKLAPEGEQAEVRQASSSSHPDGTKPLYKEIWSTKVSPKVRVFCMEACARGFGHQQ
jgi:hypothetical protein